MILQPSSAAEWANVDARLFEEVIKPRGRPAILRGVVRNWPAVAAGRTSPEAMRTYLGTFYTGHAARLFEAPPSVQGRFFYNESITGFNFESKRELLSTVLDRLCREVGNPQAPAIYSGSVSLPLYLPGFTAANHVRSLVTFSSVLESIWIGNRTCIAAHFDNTENLACVVAGKRRFTMFPPEQIRNLYVGPLDLTPAGQPVSLVDVRDPDLERFPRYAQALEVAEVAELEAGDAVYVPALWWHHVEALGAFNVLVNYWWRDVPEYFDSPSASLMHCLLTIKSLPIEQRRRWQALFNYLIFQTEEPALEHLPPETRGLFGDLTEQNAEKIRALLIKALSRHR